MTTEPPSEYWWSSDNAEEPTLPPNGARTPTSKAPPAPITPPPTEVQYRQGIEMKQEDPSLSIPDICRKLGISRRYERTMRRRCKKPNTVPRKESRKKEYLDPSDKEALFRFVEGQAHHGFAVTRPIIQLYASHLVRLRKPNFETLSDSWVHTFTHSNEFIRRFKRTQNKPLDGKRKTAQDRVNLQKWFRSYKRDIKNWKVKEDRIYNFDEGGLRVGCMRGEWVYVPRQWNNYYGYSPEDRRSVTVIEGVCADGSCIPPCIVVEGQVFLDDWFNSRQSGDELVFTSQSGFSNAQIGIEWLKHFIKHSGAEENDSRVTILLMDNHSSHTSDEFVLLANKYNIKPYPFPPHCTHILQPLDVKCFNPYKHYHDKCIKKALRQGEVAYNLVSFMWDLPEIRQKGLTPATIQSGFLTPGLWPLDEEACMNQLKVFEPDCPPDYLNNNIFEDHTHSPQTIRDTILGLDNFRDTIENKAQFSSPTRAKANRFLQCANVALKHVKLNEDSRLELIQGIRAQQKRKSELTGGRTHQSGPLRAADALANKRRKVEAEIEARDKSRSYHLGVAARKVKKAEEDIETKTRVLHRLQIKIPAMEKDMEKIMPKLIAAQGALANSIAKLGGARKSREELVEKYDKEDQKRAEEIEKMNEDPVQRLLRPAYEPEYMPQNLLSSDVGHDPSSPPLPVFPSSPPARPDPRELDLNANYVKFGLDMDEINFRL
jgi:hypothetical protein